MERIIYRKTLDLHKNGIQFTLQGFQTADKMTRTLSLSLMASGDTIDLPLEQLMVALFITTPNATVPSINECTIKDNNIICDVPPIVEEGVTEMQLKLIDTRVEGANGVLAAPKFAIEVSKSNTDEEGATQSTTFTALENALAQAKSVYDSRITRIVLSPDCVFCVYYADGTVYTSDALKDILVNGDALVSKSYARGQTGIRDGEETDNSMYYSNLSMSASEEANRVSDEATALLQEVTLHGVYTAFSLDFEKGELKYVSPMYNFTIDNDTGNLIAIGETYTFEETVGELTNEFIAQNAARYEENFETLNSSYDSLNQSVSDLSGDIGTERGRIDELSTSLSKTNQNLENTNSGLEELTDITNQLPVANGGTGANNADAARYNLGVAPAIESGEYSGCYYRIVDNETEWINPPMLANVEYRTTERYYGSPVYVQKFYYSYPDVYFTIDLPEGTGGCVGAEAYYGRGGASGDGNIICQAEVECDNNNAQIWVDMQGISQTPLWAEINVKYTKG